MPRPRADLRLGSRYMTSIEAAAMLSVTDGRIRQLVGEGKLKGKNVPPTGNLAILRTSVEAYRNRGKAPTADRSAIPPPYLTKVEAAAKLGITRQRIGQYIAEGRLATRQFGRFAGIHPRTLEAFRRTIGPGGRPPTRTRRDLEAGVA